jgi:hypothetical protein
MGRQRLLGGPLVVSLAETRSAAARHGHRILVSALVKV